MQNNRSLRCSNIELLRIVAMFLVLVAHADFYSLGIPTMQEMQSVPIPSYTRLFIEALSIVCVNVFVLISGWFGIKASTKGLMNFGFQCLFFLAGIYSVCVLTGLDTLSIAGVASTLCIGSSGWFIKAYVCLYILAPVLNAFINTACKRQVQIVLIAFFVFQTIYGWTRSTRFFVGGYSAISFVGLYLLGRYLRVYLQSRCRALSPRVWLSLYLLCAVLTTTIEIVVAPFSGHFFSLVSPLVIVGAVALLLAFANMKIRNSRLINRVAASSFAVYLLHNVMGGAAYVFVKRVNDIYASTDGVMCIIYIGVFLAVVFAAAILIDRIRMLLWRLIVKGVEKISVRHSLVDKIWSYKSKI